MKRLFFTLAIILVCGNSNAQMLWKITKDDLKTPSYIVGTHHYCTETYCDSIPGLSRAFEVVSLIVGEYNMLNSKSEILDISNMMMMPPDTSLSSLFSEEEILIVDTYLKNTINTSIETFDKFKPMAVIVSVQTKIIMNAFPSTINALSMDKCLQIKANGRNKNVDGLESTYDQMKLLFGGTLKEQAQALLEAAHNNRDSLNSILELTNAYKSQNLEYFGEIFMKYMAGYDYENVVNKRNANWEKRISIFIQDQPTLIIVGAGHLPGEFGIINRLKKQGYKLEPVRE